VRFIILTGIKFAEFLVQIRLSWHFDAGVNLLFPTKDLSEPVSLH